MEDLRWLRSLAVAAIVMASVPLAAQDAPPAGVPSRVRVCDRVRNAEACAEWKWNGQDFDYDYGPVAGKGTIAKQGELGFILSRTDTRDPWLLKGESAEYQGSLDSNTSAHGTVQYSLKGRPAFTGTWTATFAPVEIRSGSNAGNSAERNDPDPPVKAARAQPLAELAPSRMDEVCHTAEVRTAMQELEQQTLTDPGGLLLVGAACLLMGSCPDMGTETIIDSQSVSDGGRLAVQDPGAFVCRGTFLRQGAHINASADADAAATLAGSVTEKMLAANPHTFGWYKVAPITKHHFEITLLPSLNPLTRVYMTTFDLP